MTVFGLQRCLIRLSEVFAASIIRNGKLLLDHTVTGLVGYAIKES